MFGKEGRVFLRIKQAATWHGTAVSCHPGAGSFDCRAAEVSYTRHDAIFEANQNAPGDSGCCKHGPALPRPSIYRGDHRLSTRVVNRLEEAEARVPRKRCSWRRAGNGTAPDGRRRWKPRIGGPPGTAAPTPAGWQPLLPNPASKPCIQTLADHKRRTQGRASAPRALHRRAGRL